MTKELHIHFLFVLLTVFYADSLFTTKENGAELGMMVSFSTIQSLGGKSNVTSKTNKGTLF
ncbi:hypothetical protein [Domibacillus robiginosus]|uniref:hypothetical protein n=1 Tax=Domibacillus robiginosus TaxID=1071054 RepID=UPI0012DFF0C9|nr:hypothetical protein [Domibacillus robiginosus]